MIVIQVIHMLEIRWPHLRSHVVGISGSVVRAGPEPSVFAWRPLKVLTFPGDRDPMDPSSFLGGV